MHRNAKGADAKQALLCEGAGASWPLQTPRCRRRDAGELFRAEPEPDHLASERGLMVTSCAL
jgi:hypothetical protein